MKVEILMPKMGESITEGRILKWTKKPGDQVDKDETVLEIATDKVDTEVPAPATGVLVQQLAQEGDTVEVGRPVAILETDASQAQVVADAATAPAAAPTPAAAPAAPQAVAAGAPAADTGARFYSPVVMRIAAEKNIPMAELASIPGTGTGGRVTKNDLHAWLGQRPTAAPMPAAAPVMAAAPQPAASPVTRTDAGAGVQVVPMDNMQRLMAEHMVHSVHTSPHVTLVSEVDMSRIVRFKEQNEEAFKAREGVRLTFMPFIAEACIRALKDFPLINASIDGTSILMKRAINLGIAVAMDDGGLIVPVVKNADGLNVAGLARSIADVASRARKRRLQPEEIQDGTFTITNFGVFGNLFGTPIINQPQIAIFGVGAVKKRPVVIEQETGDVIGIRPMMMISLSFDHRLIDGALGGKFVERVAYYLENANLASF